MQLSGTNVRIDANSVAEPMGMVLGSCRIQMAIGIDRHVPKVYLVGSTTKQKR